MLSLSEAYKTLKALEVQNLKIPGVCKVSSLILLLEWRSSSACQVLYLSLVLRPVSAIDIVREVWGKVSLQKHKIVHDN